MGVLRSTERPSRYLDETAPPTRGPAIFHHQSERWRVLALFPLAAACPPRMLLPSSQGPFSLVHTMVLTRFRLAVCLGNMADGVHSTYFPFWLLPLCERRTNAGSIRKRNISSCNRHAGGRAPAPRLIVIFRFQTPAKPT
ncbi:hypothetical protein BO79DRAFT_233199 [Aspergillus costaricaensis CBS 115574]|uniref:Uncharacterized protein n=1 Tax=Aspergillus costaricaensis CBS 115574 TaxID=1448317 RepID=A0ACD1HZY2_9EURO|nr:hypothetical protein BO79DRAFT_233199 [Aspergillus costaricaensis CBS 115574]RAK83566.1 hypothetical protein BO79DRAFT_233199 [Aspergillus costaricaensis CBS 115574]